MPSEDKPDKIHWVKKSTGDKVHPLLGIWLDSSGLSG
jgi:hypothetical protein